MHALECVARAPASRGLAQLYGEIGHIGLQQVYRVADSIFSKIRPEQAYH